MNSTRCGFRRRCFLLISVALFVPTTVLAEDESSTTEYVVAGRVVDAETGEPVKLFRVLPGVPFRSWRAEDETLAVWQPHLVREMKDGVLSWPRKRGYEKFCLRIEAEGYQPATSPWTGRKQPQITPEIRLQRAKYIKGVVLNSDGRAAAGATMSVSLPNSPVRLDGCRFQRQEEAPESLSDWWRIPRMMKCDEQGRFEIPIETDPTAVLCMVHEE